MFCALICSIYSGTVAGAREAFLYGIPSIAMSYDWYANIFFSLILSAVLNHILSHSAAVSDLYVDRLFGFTADQTIRILASVMAISILQYMLYAALYNNSEPNSVRQNGL